MMPVLIVDDSREDLTLAMRVFMQCGIRNPVRLMESARECLEYFEGVGDKAAGTLPCIVFLDLMMKPLSGIDVLRRLRDNPAAKGSIFIMLSGASDYTMVRDGYQLGAVTFVVKPLTCDEILRTFKNLRGVTFEPQSDGYVIVPSAAEEPVRPLQRPVAAPYL
jgi:CheY-like chemotaxis protein